MNPALRTSAAHVFVASLADPQLESTDSHHLQRVLRITPADAITVSDGAGSWASARLHGDELVLVGNVVAEPPPVGSTIVSAIPKGDRVDVIVQKLTELGVTEIVLADFARSVVRWDGDRLIKQRQRLGRVMREAAMQSRRIWLPTLTIGETFSAAVQRPGVAFAEPDGTDHFRPSCLIIGPEGGFSAEELAAPIPRISLASTILRVETAAIVGALRIVSPTV